MWRLAILALSFGPGCDCSHVPPGGTCTDSFQCKGEYTCHNGVCLSADEREAAMVRQSGLDELPPEVPVVDRHGQIRIRSTTGEDQIFAACAAHERLTGGGCRGSSNGESSPHVRGWPSEFNATDTLAARWNCTGEGELTAYALCQDARGVE